MSTRVSALLGSAALALAFAAPGMASAKTLTISWWGFNGDKLNEIIVQPFQEKCGCELVFETGNNGDRLNKVKIREGKGVDVIYLTDSFSQIGVSEGLFQPIDPAKIPNLDGLHDIAKNPQGEYGPAYTVGRIGIVYDAAKVNPPITSWNDMWREDLKGALSLPGITTTAGPMMVTLAGAKAGVDAFEDSAAAFKEIEAIKPNVVKNYQTGSEMINLFSTGEITTSVTQDFTLAQLREAIPTITWAELSDGDIAVLNTVNIPKGSENVDLAHEFINFILDPAIQKTLAEAGVDAPTSKLVELSPEAAAKWTYGEEKINSLKKIDYTKLNAAKMQWVDNWNEIFGM